MGAAAGIAWIGSRTNWGRHRVLRVRYSRVTVRTLTGRYSWR